MLHHFIQDIESGAFKFDILLASIIGFFWLKIFFLLRLTRTFGPMIKIIQAIIVDILIFTVIWGIQLLFFTCVGILLFGQVPEYESFQDTFIMLYETAIGDWDLKMYEQLATGKYVGVLFHVIVLMMNLVLLLNLIIAILSNTYMIFQPKALALYYDGVIEAIPMYKYSKEYGALICGQPPFNTLIAPLVPFFTFMECNEKTRRYNQLLLHILFIPIMIFSSISFIALNLLIMPVGYFWSLIYKINILLTD